MPQDLTVPGWYNDDHYISEKVDECNTIKFGAVEGEEFTPWTAETVRDFLAQANEADSYAPWMGYDNFVSNGNAENCSPNPLFNVMQYVAAKAIQLNAMNDGAGYEGNNAWTAQSVLDYFNAHNITAWDHFTTSGQFEDINPSNAMDLSEFLTKKAAQCNAMEFAGKTDWDEQAVLDYYQEHGINAVMVAVNSNDPNVVIVPEDAQVKVPANQTPWGINDSILNPVELTTANDVVSDDGIATAFIGTVATNAFDSTLNPGDQITGTMSADQLQVTLNNDFDGFSGEGFMKGVQNVSVTNGTQDGAPLTWSAEGSTGVTNYDVNGWVNLENLAQTGITVNYANINNRGQGNALINFANTGASDDQLNINIGENVGWLNFQTNGIETITLNSNESTANLNTYTNGMSNLVLKGDAVYNIRTMTLSTKSLDMSDLTSDGNFVCLSRSEGVNQILGGSGDDSVSVRNLTPNAVVDGGDGNDSVKLRSTVGSLQLDMKNVETLNVAMAANLDIEQEPNADPAAALFLDGSNTTGLNTFGIAGGNGYTFGSDSAPTETARPIYFTNYNMDQVNVKVTGKNFVDLNIDTIQNVTVNVGDGTSSAESITGAVHLLDARAVTINTTDDNAVASNLTPFNADLYAAKANSLTLGTAQGAAIDITGGDLSSVANVTVTGFSDVTIADEAALGQNVNSVAISNSQVGGTFTASLSGNENGNSSLTYAGSSTNQVNLTVDQNYSTVNVTTGVRDDTLTITVGADGGITSSSLKGTLGEGNDTVIVNSSTGTWDAGATFDFSGITGVEKFQLNGMTTQDARALFAAGQIKLANGLTAENVYGDSFAPSDATIHAGENWGNGGQTTFKGTLDTDEATTINGDSANGDAGGAVVAFGTNVKITKVGDLTVNGGSETNSITGTPATITGDFIVNDADGTAKDTINLTGINATGKVEITGPEAGMTGVFTADVAAAGTGIDIDTNGAASSTITVVDPESGNVNVTANGAGADVVNLGKFASSDSKQQLTIALNGTKGDKVTVAADTDLTGWTTAITGAETIALAGNANLGDLSGITDTTITGGTLQLSADVDLTKDNAPTIESGVDIAEGATVKVAGASFAPAGSVSGKGTIEIASGDADWSSNSNDITVSHIQIDEGASLQANLAKVTGSQVIGGEGSYVFADDTTFDSTIAGKFADGFGNYGIAADKTLTFDGATITGKAYNLDGPGKVVVSDADSATADSVDLSTIVLGTGDDALASFQVELGGSDAVTLGAGAEEVVVNGSDVKVNDFSVGSDLIQLGSDYSAFGSEDWAESAGAGSYASLSANSAAGGATAQALEDGKLYSLGGDFATAAEASDIAALFASVSASAIAESDNAESATANTALNGFAEKYFLAEGSDAMLITGESGAFKLWYIDNASGGTTTGVDADEITLIGTFNTAGDAALTAGCFTAGA